MSIMRDDESCQSGQVCIDYKDVGEAIAHYLQIKEATAVQPARVYARLGAALLRNGRLDEAEQIFLMLSEKYPKNPQGFVGLARVAQKQQQWEVALGRWNECMSRFPKRARIQWYVEKADVLLELGNDGEAEACRRELDGSGLMQSKSHYSGFAQVAQRRGRWKMAQGLWRECIDKFPEDEEVPQWMLERGIGFVELGLFDKAEEIFASLIEKHKLLPAYIELLRLVTRCYPKPSGDLYRIDILDELQKAHGVDVSQAREGLVNEAPDRDEKYASHVDVRRPLLLRYRPKSPDFLIVGAQKCGTTSLYAHLRRHPDIEMAPNFVTLMKRKNRLGGKEMHFFDSNNWYRGIDWYRSCFNENGKIQGEATPAYFDSHQSHSRMHRHIPDAKLVLLLRNPVRRAYSAYNHAAEIGGLLGCDGKVSFEDNVESDIETGLNRRFLRIGIYIDHLEHLLNYYSKDQLLIVISEDMRLNPQDVYNRVFDFLGVRRVQIEYDPNVAVRSYPKALEKDIYKKLHEFYKPYNERLFDFLGYRIDEWERNA